MTAPPLLRAQRPAHCASARIAALDGVALDIWPGEVRGHRRRIRLGQDHAAARAVRPACRPTPAASLYRDGARTLLDA